MVRVRPYLSTGIVALSLGIAGWVFPSGVGVATSDSLAESLPKERGIPSAESDLCKVAATKIGEVQGRGDTTPMDGKEVTIQGTVVGDFQEGGFNGYYLQDTGDGDEKTSDGIFVYDRRSRDVSVGQVLRITGTVSEFKSKAKLRGITQVKPSKVIDCATTNQVQPTKIDFPSTDFERYEGMLVTFEKPLTIVDTYNYGRYGEVTVASESQMTPSAVFAPDSKKARELKEFNDTHRIVIDDGRKGENLRAMIPATKIPLTKEALFRTGDKLGAVVGIMDYRFDSWRIQPTAEGNLIKANPRPQVPVVGGDLKVQSANVLNYFTTLRKEDDSARGAVDDVEFKRQKDKILATINAGDAAIVGLNEIENNGTAIRDLVDGLNSTSAAGKWAYIDTGKVGTDAITTAFLYQPAVVSPVGPFDYITRADDKGFNDRKNRPSLAQSFRHNSSGETVTVIVNHLKSKGSSCGDPSEVTMSYLVGNCNETRTAAVKALLQWVKSDRFNVEKTDNILFIGDMNSYDHEDPIKVFEAAGYTDLVKKFHGENSYSYVFKGEKGYLDYALASKTLVSKVTGANDWHSNADELRLIDYTTAYKKKAEQDLYAPDPYRASDHDSLFVGVRLKKEAPAPPVVGSAKKGSKKPLVPHTGD